MYRCASLCAVFGGVKVYRGTGSLFDHIASMYVSSLRREACQPYSFFIEFRSAWNQINCNNTTPTGATHRKSSYLAAFGGGGTGGCRSPLRTASRSSPYPSSSRCRFRFRFVTMMQPNSARTMPMMPSLLFIVASTGKCR